MDCCRKKNKVILGLLVMLTLGFFSFTFCPVFQANGRYEIHVVGQNLLKLDNKTGSMWFFDGNRWLPLGKPILSKDKVENEEVDGG